jgi:hypothetical protein
MPDEGTAGRPYRRRHDQSHECLSVLVQQHGRHHQHVPSVGVIAIEAR